MPRAVTWTAMDLRTSWWPSPSGVASEVAGVHLGTEDDPGSPFGNLAVGDTDGDGRGDILEGTVLGFGNAAYLFLGGQEGTRDASTADARWYGTTHEVSDGPYGAFLVFDP